MNLSPFFRMLIFGGALLCALGSLFGSAHAQTGSALQTGSAAVPQCGPHQRDGLAGIADAAAHRRFVLPVLSYSVGSAPDNWGVPFTLLVDASGRVTCQVMEDGDFAQPRTLNDSRRQLLRAMSAWRYQPFLVDGKPASVIISESVAEQRLPRAHRPLPKVPLDQVTISLVRTACFGTCPGYRVHIHGNGAVDYQGEDNVDVRGKHVYRIPPEQVAALVEDARHDDLWSMDASYRAPITDYPSYVLTLDMAGQKHEIEDYAGQMVGMPKAISDFEEKVDRVGRTQEWTHLSMAAIVQLQKEGFDFSSQQAAGLLARAVDNDEGNDEAAMLRMVEFGTPITSGNSVQPPRGLIARTQSTLLENALLHRRMTLTAPLVERGVLNTHGTLDKQKIDKAFRDAIRGGRLESVQKIWNLAGENARPSLWFEDEDKENGRAIRGKVPVSLLLSRPYKDTHWEGLQIAEWLAAKGCDLKAHAANGDTLLRRAVDASDMAFVRYLLAQGLDVSAPGEFGLPALGSAKNEDIALLLLQAGSNWQMDDSGAGFKRYARDQHWARVQTWLAQHLAR